MAALTDSDNPNSYWGKLKERVEAEGGEWQPLTKCQRLKLPAPDGKMRETDCADIETLNRIVQSIPSPPSWLPDSPEFETAAGDFPKVSSRLSSLVSRCSCTASCSGPRYPIGSEPPAVSLSNFFVCQVAELPAERRPVPSFPALALAELAIGTLEMQMRNVLTDYVRAFGLDELQ